MSVDPGELSDLSCLSFLVCKVGCVLCCCSAPPGSRARLGGRDGEGGDEMSARGDPTPSSWTDRAAPGY